LARALTPPRLAIVGSESLIGRELRELLSERRLAAALDLVSSSESPDNSSSEQDGDHVALKPLTTANLQGMRLIFLAGTPESSRKVAEMKLSALLVDLTGTIADLPRAVVRAPMAEPERFLAPETRLATVAHPAATALSLVLRRLHSLSPVRHTVATVFEPASQRGREAVEELQQQTVGLLSLKSFPKAVFDDQLSFNLLSRLGADAPVPLANSEARIERDLDRLLSVDPAVPIPSLRVIHAPVFHGYSLSLWVDFAERPDIAKLSAFLKAPQVDVRSLDEEAPSNVGMAGQAGVAIDAIHPDTRVPTAAWVWIVADNVRMLADNAVLIAASLLEQSERPVQ